MTDMCLKRNYTAVVDAIAAVCASRSQELQIKYPKPRLVAVSKTKPKELIIEAYKLGQQHFGENYVQELVEKASDPEVLTSCPDIKFHFIGHLQKNKVKKLISVAPKLFMIETVDSVELAKLLEKELGKIETSINVMVQVNTSGEENKSGVRPQDCQQLASYIIKECKYLNFSGLMTIGALSESTSSGSVNRDFETLFNLRQDLLLKSPIFENRNIELSMGMSHDFEEAIRQGSTSVRVGSKIFGARNYKKE